MKYIGIAKIKHVNDLSELSMKIIGMRIVNHCQLEV